VEFVYVSDIRFLGRLTLDIYIICTTYKENYLFQHFWIEFFSSKNTLNFQYTYDM